MFLYTSKDSIEMTVKDLHSISPSSTIEARKLVQMLLPDDLILVFIHLSSQAGKTFNSIFNSILSPNNFIIF